MFSYVRGTVLIGEGVVVRQGRSKEICIRCIAIRLLLQRIIRIGHLCRDVHVLRSSLVRIGTLLQHAIQNTHTSDKRTTVALTEDQTDASEISDDMSSCNVLGTF